MVSEGRDGRALALSLHVVIAHRPNRVIRIMIREVQKGPVIFSCYFVKYTKNIAKGSVGVVEKDARVVLNLHNFICESIPSFSSIQFVRTLGYTHVRATAGVKGRLGCRADVFLTVTGSTAEHFTGRNLRFQNVRGATELRPMKISNPM